MRGEQLGLGSLLAGPRIVSPSPVSSDCACCTPLLCGVLAVLGALLPLLGCSCMSSGVRVMGPQHAWAMVSGQELPSQACGCG